jgi:hypothetical protein
LSGRRIAMDLSVFVNALIGYAHVILTMPPIGL